jgi:hypothetical protein
LRAGQSAILDPLTLNQRVQGSSPCAPTSPINGLGLNWVLAGKTGAPCRAPAQPASRGRGQALPATGHKPRPAHQRPRYGLNFGRNLSKRDDRRRRPRSNTHPMHVAEIVPSADKQTSRASAKTHCAGYPASQNWIEGIPPFLDWPRSHGTRSEVIGLQFFEDCHTENRVFTGRILGG